MDFSQGNTTDSIFRQSTGFCRLSFFCSVLLPYIPFPMRQPLILFTKFLELRECLSCPKQRFEFGNKQVTDSSDAISEIFAKLSPFLSEQERSQFSQMQNMMQMLKLYQTFQELAPFMNMGGNAAADAQGGQNPDAGLAFAAAAEAFMGAGAGQGFAHNGGAATNPDTGQNPPPDTGTVTEPGMGQLFGQGADLMAAAASSGDMGNMLLSMLSPEQKEMFENIKAVMSEPPSE